MRDDEESQKSDFERGPCPDDDFNVLHLRSVTNLTLYLWSKNKLIYFINNWR